MAGMKFDAHYFSEIDPWAVDLYQKRFPDAIPLGDIRGIDGKALADTGHTESPRRADTEESSIREARGQSASCCGGAASWIITGGFPCTDISYAGKGAGLEGAQSGLWHEMHRIIGELRPRYAIVENVAALFTRGIDVVLGSLAEIGYDAEWETIRASDVGAPHRRERVWIVAYPCCERRRKTAKCVARGGDSPVSRNDGEAFIVADTEGAECSRERGATRAWGTKPGCGGRWEVEPAICGVADGLSLELDGYEGRLATKSHQRVDRLRGLGNSIVPQIAALLFEQIRRTW